MSGRRGVQVAWLRCEGVGKQAGGVGTCAARAPHAPCPPLLRPRRPFDMQQWKRFYHYNSRKPEALLPFFWKHFELGGKTW